MWHNGIQQARHLIVCDISWQAGDAAKAQMTMPAIISQGGIVEGHFVCWHNTEMSMAKNAFTTLANMQIMINGFIFIVVIYNIGCSMNELAYFIQAVNDDNNRLCESQSLL